MLPQMAADTLLADKAFDADQRVIEPLHVRRGRSGPRDAAVAGEHAGDRAGRGQRARRHDGPGGAKVGVDLARAPAALVADGQDLPLDRLAGAVRRMRRPPRAVGQRGAAGVGVVDGQPLVGRLAADAERAGRGGDRAAERADGVDQG